MHVVVAHIAMSPALSFDIEPWPAVIGTPLRPIHAARQTSRRAASISVATSASTCWMRCCSSSGVPSSALPSRYSSVHSYAACALPRPGLLELLLELVHASEQVVERDAHVLEHDLGGLRSADAELVLLLALREARRSTRDDERCLAAVAELGVDGRDDHVHVGDA